MSKRKPDDEIELNNKVPKLSDGCNDGPEAGCSEQNRNEIAAVDRPNEEIEPEIFKLNPHCFYEIFDRMMLPDLNSFARTCKTMQQFAGEFFQKQYKTVQAEFANGEIYSTDTNSFSLNGFGTFIQRILIDLDRMEHFAYFSKNCKDSIKEIHLKMVQLNQAKIQQIKDIVGKVEVIKLTSCEFDGDFYEEFLKFAPNLKHLAIEQEYFS